MRIQYSRISGMGIFAKIDALSWILKEAPSCIMHPANYLLSIIFCFTYVNIVEKFTTWKVSVFRVYSVRIFPHLDWGLRRVLYCLNLSIWEELTLVYKLTMTRLENECLVWHSDHSEIFMWDKGDIEMGGWRCPYDGPYYIYLFAY